jgi:hypothetical protein
MGLAREGKMNPFKSHPLLTIVVTSAILWAPWALGGESAEKTGAKKGGRAPASVVASPDLSNPVSEEPAWYSDPQALKAGVTHREEDNRRWRLIPGTREAPPAWKRSYFSLGTNPNTP